MARPVSISDLIEAVEVEQLGARGLNQTGAAAARETSVDSLRRSAERNGLELVNGVQVRAKIGGHFVSALLSSGQFVPYVLDPRGEASIVKQANAVEMARLQLQQELDRLLNVLRAVEASIAGAEEREEVAA